jgi:tetratricopeptide (TPR) repeat protein
MRSLLALALAVSVALALPRSSANAADAGPSADPAIADRFAAADELRFDGDAAAAARAYEAIAADAPDDRKAPDALFQAALLHEESLGEPVRALALYRQLGARYPDAGVAVAAARRAAALTASIGPDAASADAVARWSDLEEHFPERPEADSIALAEALVRERDTWPGVAAVAVWIGDRHQQSGRLDAAARWYQTVLDRWPDSPAALDAKRGLAEVATAAGELDRAEALYRELLGADDGTVPALAAAESLALVARERWRARVYTLAALVFVAAVIAFLASLGQAARAPRAAVVALRPPLEVVYMLPVGALLYGAALTTHEDVAPAVGVIVAGGLILAWLNGAALAASLARRRPRHRLRVALHTAIIAIAIPALCYVALHRARLLDQILETVRFGPE